VLPRDEPRKDTKAGVARISQKACGRVQLRKKGYKPPHSIESPAKLEPRRSAELAATKLGTRVPWLQQSDPMSSIHNFTLFLAAGILLNLTPGPDTAYILGRSIAHGRAAGIASALGISVGSIFHTCVAALGLSAFLVTTTWAFTAVKLIGGVYLIFLGLRMLFQRQEGVTPRAGFRSSTPAAAFGQGILTNILNPKVALFFLAFLPQFIDPAATSKVPAFLLLGFTFVLTGTLWCLVLASFAAALSKRLRENRTISTALHRAVASLFVFLGARLALVR
jgi:threonine/homoserine/homoserine lactone efflux protein